MDGDTLQLFRFVNVRGIIYPCLFNNWISMKSAVCISTYMSGLVMQGKGKRHSYLLPLNFFREMASLPVYGDILNKETEKIYKLAKRIQEY